MLNKKPCNSGFTLLETAISLFLVATALLAVFRLQAQNLDLQSEAYFMTVARLLVQDRMALIESAENLTEGSAGGDCGEDFPEFFYQAEIRKVQGGERLYQVRVSVFQEENRPARNLTMETYLYR